MTRFKALFLQFSQIDASVLLLSIFFELLDYLLVPKKSAENLLTANSFPHSPSDNSEQMQFPISVFVSTKLVYCVLSVPSNLLPLRSHNSITQIKYSAHLFTCTEQINTHLMETTFYMFGVEYLRWTDKEGNEWSAVKEQVEFFGKDFFEWDPEDNPEGACTEENPYSLHEYEPTEEELKEASKNWLNWLRQEEIM